MNRHCVARSTIQLGMGLRIEAEYSVIDDAKMLWQKLASAYKSKLKFKMFDIREDDWSIKLQDCRDVNNYPSRIDLKVKHNNPSAGASTTDPDSAGKDTAKTVAMISTQQHIIYLRCRNPRNDDWTVFLELMVVKNSTMTTMPNEIGTLHIEKEYATERDNGFPPETPLFG